jgi:hypothetical protein
VNAVAPTSSVAEELHCTAVMLVGTETELDVAGFGMVKAPFGIVWMWEPKEAFHEVARWYAST